MEITCLTAITNWTRVIRKKKEKINRFRFLLITTENIFIILFNKYLERERDNIEF